MSALPEDVQAIHDRWLADKLASDEVDEGLPGPGGNLYYADDDDFWRDYDGLAEAYVEVEHPRGRTGRWIPKFVLSPIGIPGSGKGTIGKLLARHYSVPHISVGDMFRALPRDSELGRQVFPLIERGNLVPDEVTTEIVAERLAKPDVRDGVVLDGFPRTQRQKEMVEQMGYPLTYLELALDRDVAVDRLLKRAEIEGRADDTPDVIANRFRVYDAETGPMMERMRATGEIVSVPVVPNAAPEANATRAKKALAASKLNEAYREFQHPRDRRGRWIEVPDYIRGIIPNAHIVGGAVRDKLLGKTPKDYDFLAPGEDHETLVEKLAPHGRVEELIVDERKVGVRFFPDDPAVPTPAEGIEIAPPRTERSTGKGRHEFEIVADATVPPEQDMERRDFTVNAIAEAPDGTLVDPLGGAKDAKNKVLRVVGGTAFRDDGLRIIRGLRFISQHDLTPDEGTLDQMRTWARRIRDVSGERQRIEWHKLLMGKDPAKALRIARDTGVLAEMLPEFEPMIGFEQQSKYHGLTADEHTFEVVQAAADADMPLPVRIAAFWHDSGKPESAWMGEDGRLHYYANEGLGKRAHEEISVDLFRQASGRLAYPNELRAQVRNIIAAHMFRDHTVPDAKRARKFRAKHGDMLADWLIQHKRADVGGKETDDDERMNDELERLDQFKEFVEQERDAPVFVRDLELDGNDLIALGFTPGPGLGQALEELRTHVIGNPSLNTRAWLEGEARRILKRQRAVGPGEDVLAEAYIERLHPRDRLGRWSRKLGRALDVDGPGALMQGKPTKRGAQRGRKSPVKGKARGWRERVSELRREPLLQQNALKEHYRAASKVTGGQKPPEPREDEGDRWYARKVTRDDLNTRQMTGSEARDYRAMPEEDLPYAVFSRQDDVTVAYYSSLEDAEAHVERSNEHDRQEDARIKERLDAKRAEYAEAEAFLDEWWGGYRAREAPWKAIGDVTAPEGYEKGKARIVYSSQEIEGRIRTVVDVYFDGEHIGSSSTSTWGENAQEAFERVMREHGRSPEMGTVRGKYQSASGDPGTAFEEQHARIMEAGAALDAEIERRMRTDETMARVRELRSALREYKRQRKQAEQAEHKAAWQVVGSNMNRAHGKDKTPEEWEKLDREYRAEMRAAIGARRRAKKVSDEAMYFGPYLYDMWEGRYNDAERQGVDLQALHDAAYEARGRVWKVEEQLVGLEPSGRRVRREKAYEVLGEVRDLAEPGDLVIYDPETHTPVEFGDASRARSGVNILHEATKWLPRDWIDSSNEHRQRVAVGWEERRGHYSRAWRGSVKDPEQQYSRVLGSPSPGVPGPAFPETIRGGPIGQGEGTMLHELVHRTEHVRDAITGAEWTFYVSRVSPGTNRAWPEPEALSSVTGISSYEDHERTRVDEFTDAYSGKTYGDNMDDYYEILSMGVEDLVTGTHGIIEKDEEYRQFVLGSLALL